VEIFNDELSVWINLIYCKKRTIWNNNLKNSNGWSVDIESVCKENNIKLFVNSYSNESNMDFERSSRRNDENNC